MLQFLRRFLHFRNFQRTLRVSCTYKKSAGSSPATRGASCNGCVRCRQLTGLVELPGGFRSSLEARRIEAYPFSSLLPFEETIKDTLRPTHEVDASVPIVPWFLARKKFAVATNWYRLCSLHYRFLPIRLLGAAALLDQRAQTCFPSFPTAKTWSLLLHVVQHVRTVTIRYGPPSLNNEKLYLYSGNLQRENQ